MKKKIYPNKEDSCLDVYGPLRQLVSDQVKKINVGHIFRGEVDKCLEYFGEQDEECIKHNAKR